MIIYLILAFNLLLSLFNVYMASTEAKTISFILDWIIEHETKEGKKQ